MHPPHKSRKYCVPVSTTDFPCPGLETHDPTLGEIGRAFHAIRELKALGWVVGCDSELLPPLWALREFDGN